MGVLKLTSAGAVQAMNLSIWGCWSHTSNDAGPPKVLQQGMYPQVAAAVMQPEDMLPIQPEPHQAVPLGNLDGTLYTGEADDNRHPNDDDAFEDDRCKIPWEPWIEVQRTLLAEAGQCGVDDGQS